MKLEKQKLQSHTPGGQDQIDAVPSKDDKSSHVKHPAADFLVVYATPAGKKLIAIVLSQLIMNWFPWLD